MAGKKIASWFLAARPKTLPAAIVPVWSGCLLSWEFQGSVNLWLASLTLVGAICIQIATNFFNDVIDAYKGADTKDRVGPQRATISGLLKPVEVYTGAGVMLMLACLCGYFLSLQRGWPIVAIGVPSLYLSYGYTGGFFPLAYRGVGELFVILFFGIIAVTGTVFIQTGTWLSDALILGVQIGLLSAVLIAVNNYRDVEEDRVANKRTLAVRFGRRAAKIMILLMTMTPAILLLLMEENILWLIGSFLLAVTFIIAELKMLKSDGCEPRLLGLSALHLILFVVLQNVGMTIGN